MKDLETVGDLEKVLKGKGINFRKVFEVDASKPSTHLIYEFKDSSGELHLTFSENLKIAPRNELQKFSKKIEFNEFVCGYIEITPPYPFEEVKEFETIGSVLNKTIAKKYGLQVHSVSSGKEIRLSKDIKYLPNIMKNIQEMREVYFFLEKVAKKIPSLIEKQIKKDLEVMSLKR